MANYNTPTTGYVKRSWIRNPEPPGQPAPGHIKCPCGHAPETMYRPETGNVTCQCGTIYTWDGWIIHQPKLSSA